MKQKSEIFNNDKYIRMEAMGGEQPPVISISTSNTMPVKWKALNKDTFIKILSMSEWHMHMMCYALFHMLFINYLV